MKKILYIFILLLFYYPVYSQNYDLIVTTTGDSIACRIDSITDTEIYFEMKVNNNWFHTYTNKNDITEYKRNEIDKKSVVFKTGTSYIKSTIEYYENTIYATVGFALMYGAANVNYERMIWKSQDQFVQALWLRVGVGAYVAWGDEGINYVVTLNALTGKRNAHLEFGLGVTSFGGDDFPSIFPAGALGYRFQKPKGHFIFRIGVGWPESIYLSFGTCF
jgi:hypothetical protein